MVQKPIVFLSLVWTFAPNALPQPLQKLTAKLAINDFTRGYEFLVDNAVDVKKNQQQHVLDMAANLTRFFWSW
jgi:chemotaxis methyl-accepting protein methylase